MLVDFWHKIDDTLASEKYDKLFIKMKYKGTS